MKAFALILFLVLFLPCVSATTLITPESASITDALVQVREGDSSVDYLISLSNPLDLSGASEGMIILVKAGAGETFEYYAELSAGQVPESVVVWPTGLVLGEVRDAADNLIVHASISIDCPSKSVQLESDGAGAFRVFLPAEQCKFAAAKEERAASTSLMVEQGLVTNVALALEPQVTDRSWWWFALLLVIIVVTVVAAWYMNRPTKAHIKPERSPEALKTSFVAEEHKAALKEKETLIIDELLLRDGKARISELRTATKIPRTSLLRCLEGLEHRGLVLKKTEKGKPVAELIKK